MKINYAHATSSVVVFLKNTFCLAILSFVGIYVSAQQSSHSLNFKGGSIYSKGLINDELIVTLRYENNNGSKLGIVIINEEGERIFSNIYKEQLITKDFKFPADIGVITFILSNPVTKAEQQFKINAQRRYVDDVSVTRVN